MNPIWPYRAHYTPLFDWLKYPYHAKQSTNLHYTPSILKKKKKNKKKDNQTYLVVPYSDGDNEDFCHP